MIKTHLVFWTNIIYECMIMHEVMNLLQDYLSTDDLTYTEYSRHQLKQARVFYSHTEAFCFPPSILTSNSLINVIVPDTSLVSKWLKIHVHAVKAVKLQLSLVLYDLVVKIHLVVLIALLSQHHFCSNPVCYSCP